MANKDNHPYKSSYPKNIWGRIVAAQQKSDEHSSIMSWLLKAALEKLKKDEGKLK
jgi:hypothetical protein